MAKLGYCRCSTVGQDTAVQQAKLVGLGVDEKHIYVDHGFTGKTMTRDGLTNVLKALRVGDELVVPSIDRLARNARETLRVVDELTEAGVSLNFGGSVYEPGSPMSRLLLTILAEAAGAEGGWISIRANARETLRVVDELTEAGVSLNFGGSVYVPGSPMSGLLLTILAEVAEAEGGWISARTKEALAAAAIRAKLKGNRADLTATDDRRIAEEYERGVAVAELAGRFNIGRRSIYRAIARHWARVALAEAGDESAA